MAYTIRLDWIRKILSTCDIAGKPKICNEEPMWRVIRNNSSTASGGSESRKMGRIRAKTPYNEAPFRVNTSPNVHLVRIHPLVKGQNKKPKRLPTDKAATMRKYNAQRREGQLAQTMRSQDPNVGLRPSSTIPLKIFGMAPKERIQFDHLSRDVQTPSQLAIDLLKAKNMERMVRDSQSRLLNERVKKLFEKHEETEAERKNQIGDRSEKSENDSQIMTMELGQQEAEGLLELLKKAISLGCFNCTDHSEVKYVKISRIQTKLEWNGMRPSHCTIDSFTAISGNKSENSQSTTDYHMHIRCAKMPRPPPKTMAKKSNSQLMASTFMKDEQRRLDRLKAEKEQLTMIHDPAKCSDLDISSTILDPKVFVTKSLDQHEISSANPDFSFSSDIVENPDIFSQKMSKRGIRKPKPKLFPN
ncbi:uncharacterized protein LOC108116931 isoform X2 [Drosophila eugracilis]|uniref:uncharacterized protein LOC108116931 isoform X2 n=1 Tax=Drosophila eugracilis TaxID=29029 RepID=UPI0007E656EC|nr:uncharacterized protein LOC108116931 isoform X2 [Drosophila eugracilis]